MKFTSQLLFAISGLVAGVFASPLEERASSKCVTYASGSLTTGNITVPPYQKFSLNSKKEVAFYPAQNKPAIQVQFQTCTPNWAGASNKANSQYLYGRIYIPSIKACIGAVGSNDNTNYPYPVAAVPCLSSASGQMTTSKSFPQNFAYVSTGGGRRILEWTGKAKAGFTTKQNSCPTGLGYLKLPGNQTLPATDSNNHRILLSCIGNSNFQSELFAELH